MIDFRAQADALSEKLIARRRDLHRHPETAFEEVRTAGIVADALRELGLEVQTGVGKTGVVAILEGSQDGPTILVRADMDALPIHEENDFEYASQTAGKMHACGHDGHTSIALGVAELLSARRDSLAGRVKFVFQPAEEVGRGAQAMVDEGVMRDPRPDVTVGLHLWNSLPYGEIGIADGAIMAGATVFHVKITGKGSHAASPHLGIDPVVCAAQIIGAFQTIVSRNIDPMDTLVISVTKVNAGDTHNVIPQTAELTGTVRAFSRQVRDLAFERMKTIAEQVAAAFGCSAELHYEHLTIPVVNNPQTTEKLRSLFLTQPEVTRLDVNARTMGSEDVSLFMDDIPGVYFFVGARDPQQTEYYGHHHPRFSFDERALVLGTSLLTSAVASYVLSEG
ncbi:MAG: amidohydrolase [Anaerolineae bacterium]|nr:amidohydrolase [Anaerolineae bacterium]